MIRGSVKVRDNMFAGTTGVLVGGDNYGPLSDTLVPIYDAARNWLVVNNFLFISHRPLGDGSDVALPFPSLGLGECVFSLASVTANSQQHNVGSDRTGLFVPAIDRS